MNASHTLSLALAALALATGARAQTATSTTGSGLLGQRYAEASIGAIDPHGVSDEGFAGDLGVNLPIQPGIDVGFGYNYTHLNADLLGSTLKQRSRSHVLSTSATAYTSYAGVKPFASAALGYQWNKDKLDFGGVRVLDDRDNEAVWGLGIGVEVPLASFTVTPAIGYQDGFKNRSTGAFTYGVGANLWVTRTLGGFADVTYVDPTGGGTQSWTYKLGVRLRF